MKVTTQQLTENGIRSNSMTIKTLKEFEYFSSSRPGVHFLEGISDRDVKEYIDSYFRVPVMLRKQAC